MTWKRSLAVACVAIVAYFSCAPLVRRDLWHLLRPRHLASMEDARGYYAVVGYFFGALSAAGGLLLGYFYYIDKQRHDREHATRDQQRALLGAALQDLDDCDDLVETLLRVDLKNQEELDALRSRIRRSFDRLVDMLEGPPALLGLSEAGCRTILKVYSFVDKNQTLMEREFAALNREEIGSHREEYTEAMRLARRAILVDVAHTRPHIG